MLSPKQTQDVCNIYSGVNQCRYLSVAGFGACHCLRKNAIKKAQIDKEVTAHIQECNKKGIDPYQGHKPLYDGGPCQGFIILAHKVQGKT